jgi:hypothetical protein
VEVGVVAGAVAVTARFVSSLVGMVVAGVAIGWLVWGIAVPTVDCAAVVMGGVVLVVVGAKLVVPVPATVVVVGASAYCLCLPGRSCLVCCASVCRSLKSLG